MADEVTRKTAHEIREDLLQLFLDYFSDMGGYLLKRELDALALTEIKIFSDWQKLRLVDALVENVFSEVFSKQKLKILQMELLDIVDLSLDERKRLEYLAKIEYDNFSKKNDLAFAR